MKYRYVFVLVNLLLCTAGLAHCASEVSDDIGGGHEPIVGGVAAQPGEFPWMVSIVDAQWHPASPEHNHLCGGMLIHPKWVLTAAHCFERPAEPITYMIYAGNQSRASNQFNNDTYLEFPKRIILHPAYRKGQYNFDIALVALSDSALEHSPHAGIATLSHVKPAVGARGTIAGWGFTGREIPKELQKAEVLFRDSKGCSALGLGFDDRSELCASAPWVDTCGGDSGGPIAVTDGAGNYVVAGITSRGGVCAASSGIYTSVADYLPWIREHVK